MKRTFILLLILACLHPVTHAQRQYILKSAHIAVSDTIWVFTPMGYSKTVSVKFPVVFLLHGWNGSYHQWNDITDCQSLADRYGFIIVCPDGLTDSWYINSPAIKSSQYTDFFFLDLFPFITSHYRTDSSNVFITGLSMGGHGALYLFAQHPDLFRSAGSLSGVLDLGFCGREYGIDTYLGIPAGETGKEILTSWSVSGQIDRIADSEKKIILSCGSSDRFFELNNTFKRLCDTHDIDATYFVSPGGHDYPYWKSAIGAHLDFFRKMVLSEK
jgi:S-formylglutathione hydrolase FrmB